MSEREDLPSVLFGQYLCERGVHGSESADDSDGTSCHDEPVDRAEVPG